MTAPAFLTDPAFERAGAGQFRLVGPPLVAVVAGQTLEVPVGFTTDGASIPPLFWPMVGHPYSPSSLRAAILHDFLCRTRPAGFSSILVHRIFFETLMVDGCARPRAWSMWLAVRVFGPRWPAQRPG